MPRVEIAIAAVATLLACKGSEPQPQPEVAGAPEPALAPTAAPEPTPPPVVAPPGDSTSTSTTTGGEPEEAKPEVVAPPPAPAPAPAIETHTLPADADPLRFLLGKGVPEAVEVLAVHEHGRERIALYRLDVVAQWSAGRPDAETILEPLDDLIEGCSSYEVVDPDCVTQAAAKYPDIPGEVAGYYGYDSDAFELAHVELDSEAKGTVLARRRLYDHGHACDTEERCFETKLKVYDMDGDKRSEILVVFPLEVPSDFNFRVNTNPAALAFVFDKSDFHVQFATTRKYYDEGGDLSFHEADFETSFVARDTNADGHADLVLREAGFESRGEEGEPTEKWKTDESTTCLYEYAGDRWVCPVARGKQLIDGTKLVEVTRIPLPPPVVPDAAPPPEKAP